MPVKVTKINDIVCKKINVPKVDPKTVKGYDVIKGNVTPNIFIIGSSGEGKTSLLYNFMKLCCDKRTIVYFFVSTYYNDMSYDVIREYCDKKGIEYGGNDEIGNELNEFAKEKMQEQIELKEAERKKKIAEELNKGKKLYDEKQYSTMSEVLNDLTFEDDGIKVRVRKPKKVGLKYLFVFDDMSQSLRDKSVRVFLKKRRHYGVCNWIASQNYMDLDNHARNNINIYILFGSMTPEKLVQFYEDAQLKKISFDQFMELYEYATAERYNFLYINKDTNEYRHNFSDKLELV